MSEPDDAERALLLAWRTALLMQLAAVEKALGMRPAQAEPTGTPARQEPLRDAERCEKTQP